MSVRETVLTNIMANEEIKEMTDILPRLSWYSWIGLVSLTQQ